MVVNGIVISRQIPDTAAGGIWMKKTVPFPFYSVPEHNCRGFREAKGQKGSEGERQRPRYRRSRIFRVTEWGRREREDEGN